VRERDRRGRLRYDLVILDAPATGHGIDMLRVPQVIVEAAPAGLLRREAEEALALFIDPSRTGIALVTVPEELPTNETQELYQDLRDELRLPVCCLTVNRVLPKLFSDQQRASLAQLPEGVDGDKGFASLVIASRARAAREEGQEACITRLRESIPVPQIALPEISALEFRRAAVETLSYVIEQRCTNQ
jgi:anion-transporting  ArsA/GET3 family ATPase